MIRDAREDQLLCPKCYVPVEPVLSGNKYLCTQCPGLWYKRELTSANELSEEIRRIDERDI